MSDRPRKRSLTLRGHRTSVSLEPVFWEALQRLAAARGVSINALAAEIDDARAAADPGVSLASALRSALLRAALEQQARKSR
ncbi:MAG: ribbon-helix-helix domain-containing protein [Pseudomonadota bacterium]